MTIYEQLIEYATQLTEDREVADMIAVEVIRAGCKVAIETMDADKAHAFMIVTARNKCENYNRWRATPEADAAILGVSIGEVAQVKRALAEGRFMQ